MERNAFTLLELLVVIAVIAVLMGVLIPSLQAVKKQAQSVICGKNMTQLAMGFIIYNDENGTLTHGFKLLSIFDTAPPGGFAGNPAYDTLGWWWFNYIMEEEPAKGSVVWCPSRKYIAPSVKNNVLCGNYGVNRSICKDAFGNGILEDEFIGKPLRLTHLRHPSQMLLLTDSGYSLASWKAATNAVSPRFDNPNREEYFYIPGMSINTSSGSSMETLQGRHPNKTVNVTYTDGHVERIKADELTVENTGGQYRNISPLWKP